MRKDSGRDALINKIVQTDIENTTEKIPKENAQKKSKLQRLLEQNPEACRLGRNNRNLSSQEEATIRTYATTRTSAMDSSSIVKQQMLINPQKRINRRRLGEDMRIKTLVGLKTKEKFQNIFPLKSKERGEKSEQQKEEFFEAQMKLKLGTAKKMMLPLFTLKKPMLLDRKELSQKKVTIKSSFSSNSFAHDLLSRSDTKSVSSRSQMLLTKEMREHSDNESRHNFDDQRDNASEERSIECRNRRMRDLNEDLPPKSDCCNSENDKVSNMDNGMHFVMDLNARERSCKECCKCRKKKPLKRVPSNSELTILGSDSTSVSTKKTESSFKLPTHDIISSQSVSLESLRTSRMNNLSSQRFVTESTDKNKPKKDKHKYSAAVSMTITKQESQDEQNFEVELMEKPVLISNLYASGLSTEIEIQEKEQHDESVQTSDFEANIDDQFDQKINEQYIDASTPVNESKAKDRHENQLRKKSSKRGLKIKQTKPPRQSFEMDGNKRRDNAIKSTEFDLLAPSDKENSPIREKEDTPSFEKEKKGKMRIQKGILNQMQSASSLSSRLNVSKRIQYIVSHPSERSKSKGKRPKCVGVIPTKFTKSEISHNSRRSLKSDRPLRHHASKTSIYSHASTYTSKTCSTDGMLTDSGSYPLSSGSDYSNRRRARTRSRSSSADTGTSYSCSLDEPERSRKGNISEMKDTARYIMMESSNALKKQILCNKISNISTGTESTGLNR